MLFTDADSAYVGVSAATQGQQAHALSWGVFHRALTARGHLAGPQKP